MIPLEKTSRSPRRENCRGRYPEWVTSPSRRYQPVWHSESVRPVEIDSYVTGLSGRLRGPRRVRDELVAEARDSLVDAAESYERAGMTPDEAQRRAVTEFGSYAEVVPDYQAELAIAQGRRTVLLIAMALPVLVLAAPLMWWHSPWSVDVQMPHGYPWLTVGFDVLSITGAALALLVLVGYGRGSRYVRDGVWLTEVVGRCGLTFLVVHGASGVVIYLWSVHQWPEMLGWPPVWAGAAAMSVAFEYAALCVWRCLRVSGAQRAAARGAAQLVGAAPVGV
jgi:hypothetical protein